MRKKKVISDYTIVSDHEFNTMVGKVLDCLDGHIILVDLPITLVELKAQADDFKAKWQRASRGGSVLEIAEKNDSKKKLAASLKSIAFYVNTVADGSRSILLSSGLMLENDHKPSEVPGLVQEVALMDGKQRNQMGIKFKPLKEAIVYEYQIASTLDAFDQPVWGENFQTSTSYSNIFSPVQPGFTYYLRVRARNRRGIGDWSDAVSLTAR
ncbi:fibronectin type III domain-containing protein [Sphingobacterium faecium]|uniref:fibronectin type III domain-containing protein n=1 Tax=Sphingobacterium faecium TaxID=34087 RepID=UPI0024682551|nr:fibronectin type III domain-containing protein [Sphingobacterium faecium]MDH5828731.1 fibronectin type III domain-containing protein [Sphingobacterium faecium]